VDTPQRAQTEQARSVITPEQISSGWDPIHKNCQENTCTFEGAQVIAETSTLDH